MRVGDFVNKMNLGGTSKAKPTNTSAVKPECPVSGESFSKSDASGCPFLQSKNRLEMAASLSKETPKVSAKAVAKVAVKSGGMAAVATTPGPSLLATAKGLGLEFRRPGRGLDFWRVKQKSLSPKRALELATQFKSFEARSAEGDWSPVANSAELKLLVSHAKKEAEIAAHLATAGAAAQMVTDSMVGLPLALGTTQVEPAAGMIKPKRVGLLSFARTLTRHLGSPLGLIEELHGKHGRSFQVNTPTHGKFLFDTRTDILVDALKSTDVGDDTWKKSELQGHGAAFLIGKENVFASGGKQWKTVKEAMKPHLAFKTIKSEESIGKLTEIFDDHLGDLKARTLAAPGGELEIDARDEMQTAVLDVALQLFMSKKMPKPELRKIQSAFNTQMSWLPEETVNPTNISLANLPGNGELKEAYKVLDKMAGDLIAERRASSEKPGDMLDSFLAMTDPETNEPMSDERLKHEVLALLEAGHETTATMMGWSVLMMAKNPEEYKKLQAEVDTVVGKGIPEKSELRDLKTSQNIVDESLRMYPPFYLFMRQAKEDVTIGKPGQEINVEKGTTLVSSIYEAHRDESLWGEEKTGFPANEFHSDRFDSKNDELFAPFGVGRRSCMGQVLGKLEGNLMMTRLAQEFDILPNEHQTIESLSDLSIHPKDGKVKLRLRSEA